MKTIKQDKMSLTVYVEFLLDSIKIPQNGSPLSPLRYSWFRFCAFFIFMMNPENSLSILD